MDRLATDFGGFHDTCLREISVATETFIGENLSMACPGHLDTSALLFLQSQNRTLPAIEISCERVTSLRLSPTPDGCDSVIMDGEIKVVGKGCRIALNFIGGPLKGPPSGSVLIPAHSFDEPDLEISAGAMSWRPVQDGMGEALRYRKQEST